MTDKQKVRLKAMIRTELDALRWSYKTGEPVKQYHREYIAFGPNKETCAELEKMGFLENLGDSIYVLKIKE